MVLGGAALSVGVVGYITEQNVIGKVKNLLIAQKGMYNALGEQSLLLLNGDASAIESMKRIKADLLTSSRTLDGLKSQMVGSPHPELTMLFKNVVTSKRGVDDTIRLLDSLDKNKDFLVNFLKSQETIPGFHQSVWNNLNTFLKEKSAANLSAADKEIILKWVVFFQNPKVVLMDHLFVWDDRQDGAGVKTRSDLLVEMGGLQNELYASWIARHFSSYPDISVHIEEMISSVDGLRKNASYVNESLGFGMSLRKVVRVFSNSLVKKTSDVDTLINEVETIEAEKVMLNKFIWLIMLGSFLMVVAIIPLYVLLKQHRNDVSGLQRVVEKGQLVQGEIKKITHQMEQTLVAKSDNLSLVVMARPIPFLNVFVGATNKMLENFITVKMQFIEYVNHSKRLLDESHHAIILVDDKAKHIAGEMERSGCLIQDVASSMISASEAMSGAKDLARSSLKKSIDGGLIVQDTINRMNMIRNTMQDTSKRIKRLGESSQNIGEVTNLIREIAGQVQILSMNAAIEAAEAGEAGRNFAVVAQEIQRLSNSSNRAAEKIDELVVLIQDDAQGAVSAMEKSTAEVVEGAVVANKAGGALKAIEEVSNLLELEVVSASLMIEIQAGLVANTSVELDILEEQIKEVVVEAKHSRVLMEEVVTLSGTAKNVILL